MAPNVDATKIHQGPGKLWLHVPEPASGARVTLAADGSLPQPTGLASWAASTPYTVGTVVKDTSSNSQLCITAGTSASTAPTWGTTIGAVVAETGGPVWMCLGAYGAYFAGATEGAISSSLTPKYEEMGADQVSAPIDVVMTADAYEVDVTIKQSNLANLMHFFPPGTFSTGTDTTQPTGAQAYEEITFGGIIAVPKMGVAVISPRRDASGKFVVSHLYSAYQAEAIKLPFQRAKETTFGVKFKALADPTRAAGDQSGTVWRQV
jgi:hypothetical protein